MIFAFAVFSECCLIFIIEQTKYILNDYLHNNKEHIKKKKQSLYQNDRCERDY